MILFKQFMPYTYIDYLQYEYTRHKFYFVVSVILAIQGLLLNFMHRYFLLLFTYKSNSRQPILALT